MSSAIVAALIGLAGVVIGGTMTWWGAWLQGRLSRRAAAEEYVRQTVQDHGNAVRIAASGLLAAIDIAAQAAYQLIDPQDLIASREVAQLTGLNMPREKDEVQGLVSFARQAFTDTLSKINEIQILEPALLPQPVIDEIRTAVLQLNHIIIVNFREDRGNIRGGMKRAQIAQLYSVHSNISKAYEFWIKQTEANLVSELHRTGPTERQAGGRRSAPSFSRDAAVRPGTATARPRTGNGETLLTGEVPHVWRRFSFPVERNFPANPNPGRVLRPDRTDLTTPSHADPRFNHRLRRCGPGYDRRCHRRPRPQVPRRNANRRTSPGRGSTLDKSRNEDAPSAESR
jgi:hypothetical protein